ncbi:transposase, partial [Enhygromyxa salina]|uniref:transposase n=1 Tax=Enhygromyxa salina TaxID=215803 RepID=UPI0015E61BAF
MADTPVSSASSLPFGDRITRSASARFERHAWKNGVHAVLLAPLDLIARLCALIPPPRFHMIRYHGVLAA